MRDSKIDIHGTFSLSADCERLLEHAIAARGPAPGDVLGLTHGAGTVHERKRTLGQE
jgi:hypothetical protein